MKNTKKKLQKNVSIVCLLFGTLNVAAGLYGFNGGVMDVLSISLGIVFLSFFARGA